MAEHIDNHDQTRLLMERLSSTFADVEAAIDQMDDPDDAFRRSNELWEHVAGFRDAIGALRARLTKKIWDKHELDLRELGEHLTRTGGRTISKTRAFQLLRAAETASTPEHKEKT